MTDETRDVVSNANVRQGSSTRFMKDPRFKLVTSLAILVLLASYLVFAAFWLIASAVAGLPASGVFVFVAACAAVGVVTNGVSAWRNRHAFRAASSPKAG